MTVPLALLFAVAVVLLITGLAPPATPMSGGRNVAHRRQVEEMMEALAEGPEDFTVVDFLSADTFP